MTGEQAARSLNARRYGGHRCWRYHLGCIVTTEDCACGPAYQCLDVRWAIMHVRRERGEVDDDSDVWFRLRANQPD